MSGTRYKYIAVIDDGESLCRSMSRLLRAAHLHPITHSSAEDFLTAHDDPEVRAQAEAFDCAGYFRKTDSGADVLAAIRRVTDGAPVRSGCGSGKSRSTN